MGVKHGLSEHLFAGFNLARDIVHRTAQEHGWWDQQTRPGGEVEGQRSFGELMALVHSEVSEALEDYRKGAAPDVVSYQYTRVGSVQQAYVVRQGSSGELILEIEGVDVFITPDNCEQYGFQAKPVGIPIELADIIIRVLDTCGYYRINIEEAMLIKARYNEGRPYRHGGKVI